MRTRNLLPTMSVPVSLCFHLWGRASPSVAVLVSQASLSPHPLVGVARGWPSRMESVICKMESGNEEGQIRVPACCEDRGVEQGGAGARLFR